MTPVPLAAPNHVPLVHVMRDGLVEGVHHGSAVVLAPDGSILLQAGDIDVACYPRSTAKPMQAVAMARLGLSLPPHLLALTAASHSGESFHLAGARSVLDATGCTEADLGTPADLPFDPVERGAWIAAGRAPRKLAHNCSGKHAAMLHTARRKGWSTQDYLAPAHPLQCEIAATVEDLTGERVAHTAIDGCGAPLFAVSLRGLATAIGRIATAAPGTPEALVAQAMRAYPAYVAGGRRDTTELMRTVPGLIAKDGFEALQVAALPDGTAMALKIADGSDRARLPATLAALRFAGVDHDLLLPLAPPAAPDGLAVTGALVTGLRR
jgi:L-asparaginase II